jgi:hypothetical protein
MQVVAKNIQKCPENAVSQKAQNGSKAFCGI